MSILLCMLTCAPGLPVGADGSPDAESVRRLLLHLDLDRPELAKVRAAATPEAAAAALLAFYRARDGAGFRHPVDRARRTKVLGHYASPASIKLADEACRNILITGASYPPRDFGDRIDWAHNPTRDNEWLWQLHRHSSWDRLADAYWHSGDEKYVGAFTRQFADWVARNPNDGKHDYAWRTIEAGIRGYRFIGLFQHFLDADAFRPAVLVAFMNSCRDHAVFLHDALGKRPEGNNWRLMEAEGLAFVAICFPQFKDAAAWRKRAFGVLNAQIARQVRPDGMHYEQCFNYHKGCISWLARTAQLARANGCEHEFGPDYFKRIESMVAALAVMSFPDGTTAQFGDTSSPVNVRDAVKPWADFFDRDDFRFFASAGKIGQPPADSAVALAASGFYSLRSDWGPDATCLVLKCGPDGGWHCQPDNGSFELFAGGRRLTPDSGTYIYSGDDAGRAWFRRTAAHQTLTLNGADSAYAPKLLLFEPGRTLDALVVQNASYKRLTHRRAVLFVDRRFFVIVDDAIGEAAGRVDVHFTLAPGKAVIDAPGLSARTDLEGGTNLLIRAAGEGFTLAQEKGEVSFHYGSREPRPAVAIGCAKDVLTAAVRLVSVLIPHQGKPPEVAISPGQGVAGGDRVELTVTVGSTRATLGYDLAKKEAWRR
ncbi:MAG: Heparin-sulfate lyase [Phycisphaerae bacterium]|nr:Heparin-sulfate lyase [Phycisphaerae bacterium]